jgi:aspartate/methionine/tyrosine aminotransferase
MNINPDVKAIIDPPLDEMNRKIASMRADGADVISLAQGISSFEPPQSVSVAVKKCLSKPSTHIYSHDAGVPSVRDALSRYLLFKDLQIDPESELLLTAGASQAFFSALMTIGHRGMKVILPSPYYFDHQFAVLACGMIPVEVPMKACGNHWSFDVEAICRAFDEGAEILVLVSPNNPTGAVITGGQLEQISVSAKRNDGVIISDETYDRFVFNPSEFVSPASLPSLKDRVIVIGSFSKSLALAGWRIGYLAAPSSVIREALKLQDTLVICAPVISQIALEAALTDGCEETISAGLKELTDRRSILTTILGKIEAFRWFEPEGAFFAFPALVGDLDDRRIALDLLEKVHVAVMAGSACGASGKGHIRLSFGNVSAPQLEEACNRIEGYFNS